jgi:hypothetical protein
MHDRNYGSPVLENFALNQCALCIATDCHDSASIIRHVPQRRDPCRRVRIDKTRDGPAEKLCRFGNHAAEEPAAKNDQMLGMGLVQL